MIYAIINDNLVKEIREIPEEEIPVILGISQVVIPIENFLRTPKVGWIWNGKDVYPDIKDITPRQARQALTLKGFSLQAIESAINSMPEPNRTLALIEWEYSTAFVRRNPLVIQIGSLLGLNADQMDDLWIFGSKL